MKRASFSLLLLCSYLITKGQTNTFPTSGNVGIGTLTPATRLHVKGDGSNPGYLALEKSSVSEETGIQFRKAGSVLFYLFNDDTNDGLKIQSTGVSGENDANPRIHLPFASKDIFLAQSGGNVGIGTSTPSNKLVVQGLGGGNIDLAVNGRIVTGDASNSGGIWIAGASNMFMGQVNTTSMGWYNNGSWRMIADNNGNVGIGTISPTQKLTVNGTIYGKEVKVDLSVPGPDYVFNDNYRLLSLAEIKNYIDQHKHLPEVPTAKEMEANGVNLGEMNMLLLKKIEELTLYILNQESRIAELEKSKK